MHKNLTVVMYHYVRDLKKSQYPAIKGLDSALFEEQLLFLKKHYHIVKMEEVIHCLRYQESLPEKALLLTFDDAYSDHYHNVFPLLQKHKLQGSFYVPVMAVTKNKVLDVNKIHFILAAQTDINQLLDELRNLLNHFQVEYNLFSFDHYRSKLAVQDEFDTADTIFIKRLLQVELEEELRMKIINKLFAKFVSTNEELFSRELYMSSEQLKEMLQAGMHIGCHGYNHYWWNRLGELELRQEIEKSCEFLRELGVDMNYFSTCYPYGGYSENVLSTLQSYGCHIAFTTETAVANLATNHPLALPRLDTNHLPKDRLAPVNSWYDLT